ncbi:MAG: outer membrane protein assembly factor [Ignavibacteriaceae bacterium]|nr:outer membrane protein assembly factor [Ignavibacteriaceae bacterium]
MRRLSIVLFLIISIQFLIFSQTEHPDSSVTEIPDTVGVGGVDWFAYPFMFYSPETSLAFGAGGIISFTLSEKLHSKPSNITASGYYTINNQYDLTIQPEVYLLEDKLKLWSKFNYGKIFDYFYGVGNSTEDIENDKYLQENFLFQFKILPKLFDERFNIGINYEFRRMNVADAIGNPFLETGTFTGSEGGTTSGLGLAISWDSRDNIFYPHSGGYYEFNGSNFLKFLGSDFDYRKVVFDFRRYFPLTQNVLAVQTYFMHVSGSPPFYDLALIGGDRVMRGYLYGRYRDRIYYAVQTEYRIPNLLWRFGLVVFAGAGDVASSIGKIEIATIKPTYGFGIRFRFDELQKLDLRADIGFGRGTSGVYFSVNQAF